MPPNGLDAERLGSCKALLPSLFLCAGLSLIQPSHGDGLRVSGLALGVGDWITITDGDGDTREDYGTLLAASLYGTGWGWNGSLSLPLKSASKRLGNQTRYGLGDGKVSLGRPFGIWSPRVSLSFPLYEWSVEDAGVNELYIGSGTWDLALGLGGRVPRRLLPDRWSLQFDVEGSTVLVQGLADHGSYHGLGYLQAAYALDNRWKAGLTTLFLFDHWIWIPDYWDQEGETRFSIMPGGVLGVRVFNATYLDFKAGWGVYEYRELVNPKYPERPQDSYHFGLSLFQAFK